MGTAQQPCGEQGSDNDTESAQRCGLLLNHGGAGEERHDQGEGERKRERERKGQGEKEKSRIVRFRFTSSEDSWLDLTDLSSTNHGTLLDY